MSTSVVLGLRQTGHNLWAVLLDQPRPCLQFHVTPELVRVDFAARQPVQLLEDAVRPERRVETRREGRWRHRLAVGIALDLRDHTLEGYRLIALGDAQQAAGQLGDALTSYQRSASLHRRLGNRSREALAWHGAGETYRRLRRPADAAPFHRQAAAAHHELDDPWFEAQARNGLAHALHDQGHTPAARAEWEHALTLLTPYDDPRATAAQHHLRERLNPSPHPRPEN